MLNFVRPRDEDKKELKRLCRDRIWGVEGFTLLEAGSLYENNFWCGKNDEGEIRALIFDNGNESYKVFGEEIPEMLLTEKFCTMIYKKASVTVSENVRELSSREIEEFYKLYSGSSSLSFDDSARYVHSLRCKMRSLSCFFGIFSENKLVSVAAVTGMNEKYALIGNVFTSEQFRNRGLALRCINKCIEFSLSAGKLPCLFCKAEMRDFYKKLGFSEYYE